MKKRVLFLAIVALLSFQAVFSAEKSSKTMYVNLSPAELMEKPSVRAKKVTSLEYGTKVTMVKEKSNWTYVILDEDSSVYGWVPSGALTKKKVSTKNLASSASASEIALAGKGFSASIEDEYARNYEINFNDVDYIESLGVSLSQNEDFIKSGNLNGASNEN